MRKKARKEKKERDKSVFREYFELIAETAARVDAVLSEGLEHHLFLGRVLEKVRIVAESLGVIRIKLQCFFVAPSSLLNRTLASMD